MENYGGDDSVTFTINGQVYQANGSTVAADTSLNTYIRDVAHLTGTKYMCREGGCGACIVAMQSAHPVTKKDQIYAVNSCLVPILSCHGKAITTVEGIGSQRKGYNKVQEYLAKFNGTQCGYCSPAMVMNMYSLLKSKPDITMKEVENSFGGNICRCTGYRPILDAFKALASDASEDLKQKCRDIEDLMKGCKLDGGDKCKQKCNDCKMKTNKTSNEKDKKEGGDRRGGEEEVEHYDVDFVEIALAQKRLKLKFGQGTALWYRVSNVFEIMQIFDLITPNTYMLVAGNTAQGVYRIKNPPNVYIDISDVAELKRYSVYNTHLELGANMTLTETMELFKNLSKENPLLYGYTKVLADHIDLVANVPVRNAGTLAGNLSIKHEHHEFPSDIFLMFLTVGAHIVIRESTGIERTVTLLEYLDMNMYNKVITQIILPPLSSNHYYVNTFKIMPRKQNVHALVNAGFLFRLNRNYNNYVEERPVIIFGHIDRNFTHAYQTENYLTGKPLLNKNVLKYALQILSSELKPEYDPVEAAPEYRKKLAMALFYRYVLSVNPEAVDKKYRSGYNNLQRPLSSGKQEYVTNEKVWPVTKPIQKLEGLIQCSGEAEFVNDKPHFPGELFGALVLSDRANGVISGVDASAALHLPGVVAFYTADDIPGVNTFIQPNFIYPEMEEVFCSSKTLYAGQPIGIIVATSQELANKATNYVTVSYSSSEKPLLTVEQVLASGDKSRIIPQNKIIPTATKTDVKHVIKGEYKMESQYHYTMELQTCLCVPEDDNMKVYSSTQWPAMAQAAISMATKIPAHRINVEVKRVGGAYGSKISRSSMIATACAIAAHKLNRPVRIVLDLETNMRAVGKRYPLLSKYDVGVNDEGEIQYLKVEMYENSGCSLNDIVGIFAVEGIKSYYDYQTWKVDIYSVKTDNACSAWTRAPGTLEAIATIENIMERIAFVTKKDPLKVRKLNSSAENLPILEEMFDTISSSSDYQTRLDSVNKFNKENRWRKKGISLLPMKYAIEFFPNYHSLVSIYSADGTVAITTGGIEMGQGINTKVAQVAAYTLGIELEKIKVNPSMVITAPNNFPTGGSIGSDTVSFSTMKSCEELISRLKPLREKMKNPEWLPLVQAAFVAGINLSASYMYSKKEPAPNTYQVYGAAVIEVEVDLLTGQYQILRADLLEDVGESLSPYIDIGQIEGAFVMGLGYFHSEHLIFDENKGKILTDRTWTYWPPGVGDIPIDMRVQFRKNAPNPKGVLRAKATGEPAICFSIGLQHALKMAIKSAKEDNGEPEEWFDFFQPCTFEKLFMTAGTDPKDFTI